MMKKKPDALSLSTVTGETASETIKTDVSDEKKPPKNGLVYSLYILADFLMRLAILLNTFQISWWALGSTSGYEGIIVFFQTTYVALIAAIVGILFATLVDSKMGVLITCLISCVFVFLSAILGILTAAAASFNASKLVNMILEYSNYIVIIFEPARLIITLLHTLEGPPKITKYICAIMIGARELAVILAYLAVEFLRRIAIYQYIINPIAIVCVVVYAVIICTVRRPEFIQRENVMAIRMTKCYLKYLPNVNRVKPKYFEPDDNFSLKEKYCTIQFLRIYRAISALIIFYFAQQLLYLVWHFQSKLMSIGGIRFPQSIQVKLAVFNLLNLPLIFGLIFPFLARTKRVMFQNNLKLVGFGYFSLFICLLITMLASFLSTSGSGSAQGPGPEESMIRIYNMIPQTIIISSSWTGNQSLEAYSLYISDKFAADGIVSSQLMITGPQPMNKFSKSIFSEEAKSATFVVVTDKMRRVSGFDDVHDGVLDLRGPVAILSGYSVLGETFKMNLKNKDTNEEISINFKEEIYLKNTQTIKPGAYTVLHENQEDITFEMGGVYSFMMYAKGSKVFPADYHFVFAQQSEPPSLPLWSLIALYFLSLASMIEIVLIIFFLITETPQAVRALILALYFFNKIIGSGAVYLIVWILNLKNLTLALFVTFWIFIANACFYWAVMIKFKSLRYTPPEE